MKTIIILLMIFGLYACDESTVTQPKDDTKVETQKYTLEEILADTNWVEVTDTINNININDNLCIVSELYKDTVLLISNLSDYKSLFSQNVNYKYLYKDSSSSCYFNYNEPNFDFLKYDKFYSLKYLSKSLDYKHKIYFNYKLNSYFYYREIWRYSDYQILVLKLCNGIYVTKKRLNNSKVFYQEIIVNK